MTNKQNPETLSQEKFIQDKLANADTMYVRDENGVFHEASSEKPDPNN